MWGAFGVILLFSMSTLFKVVSDIHEQWHQNETKDQKNIQLPWPKKEDILPFKRGKHTEWVSTVLPHLFIFPWDYCDSSGVGTSGSSKVLLQGFCGRKFHSQKSVLLDFLPWWQVDTEPCSLLLPLTEGCASETGSRFLELPIIFLPFQLKNKCFSLNGY